MTIVIHFVLWPTYSFILWVFGFFVGRCARKVPILDDKLPRALYRGQAPRGDPTVTREPGNGEESGRRTLHAALRIANTSATTMAGPVTCGSQGTCRSCSNGIC